MMAMIKSKDDGTPLFTDARSQQVTKSGPANSERRAGHTRQRTRTALVIDVDKQNELRITYGKTVGDLTAKERHKKRLVHVHRNICDEAGR